MNQFWNFCLRESQFRIKRTKDSSLRVFWFSNHTNYPKKGIVFCFGRTSIWESLVENVRPLCTWRRVRCAKHTGPSDWDRIITPVGRGVYRNGLNVKWLGSGRYEDDTIRRKEHLETRSLVHLTGDFRGVEVLDGPRTGRTQDQEAAKEPKSCRSQTNSNEFK